MLRKVAHKLTKSGGLLLAVVFAAVVGGATTAVVMAAIPSSNGTISACYKNSAGLTNPKGNLRVINSDTGDTCTSQETALNWSANSPKIAHLALNSDGTLDTPYSTGITRMHFFELYPDDNIYATCVEVGFTPKSVTESDYLAHTTVGGFGAAQSGIDSDCGSGYNAEITTVGSNPSGTNYTFFN